MGGLNGVIDSLGGIHFFRPTDPGAVVEAVKEAKMAVEDRVMNVAVNSGEGSER